MEAAAMGMTAAITTGQANVKNPRMCVLITYPPCWSCFQAVDGSVDRGLGSVGGDRPVALGTSGMGRHTVERMPSRALKDRRARLDCSMNGQSCDIVDRVRLSAMRLDVPVRR